MAQSVDYIISLIDKFSPKMARINKSVATLDKSMGGLNSSVMRLGAGLLSATIAFREVQTIARTTAELDAARVSIDFLTKSSERGAQSFEFIKKTADKMGTGLQSSITSFVTLMGAFKGTGFSVKAVEKIFEQTSMAVSAMGLSSERLKLSLLAMGQMASKGVVNMEELRRQLGDSLPGALETAARAMNVKLPELFKMVESGTLMSKEFLVKFGRELEKTFSGAVPKASETLRSALNRLDGAIYTLRTEIGGKLAPVLISTIKVFTEWVKKLSTGEVSLEGTFKWLKRIATAFVIFKTLLISTRILLAGYALSTKLVTVANWGLNFGLKGVAFALKQVKWATFQTGIGAVAIGLTFLIEKIMKTRAATKAMNDEYERTTRIQGAVEYKAFLESTGLFAKKLEKVNGQIREVYSFKSVDKVKELTKAVEKFSRMELLNLETFFVENITGLKRVLTRTKDTVTKAVFTSDLEEFEKMLKVVRRELNLVDKFTKQTTGDLDKAGISSLKSSAPKVFNINIEKLVETVNNNVENLTEGMTESKRIVTEALLDALNQTQIVALQ